MSCRLSEMKDNSNSKIYYMFKSKVLTMLNGTVSTLLKSLMLHY